MTKIKEAEQYIPNANIHLKYAFHANMNDYAEFFDQFELLNYHSQKMLEIARLMKSQEKEAYSYSGISKYYQATGNLNLAEEYLLKAINLYETVGEKTRLLNLYEGAAQLFQQDQRL